MTMAFLKRGKDKRMIGGGWQRGGLVGIGLSFRKEYR
jgi:hypothetical protein